MTVKDSGKDTQTILNIRDVPASATQLDTSIFGTSPVVGVTNTFNMNKDTRFENLVFAITSGYASNPDNPYRTDQEFAARACSLARAICYEMAKYGTL